MEIGGVTALGLPENLPIWADSNVMNLDYIILGGGNRTSKVKVDANILLSISGVEVVEGLAKEVAS